VARPTEPTLGLPTWATDPAVQAAGTAPTSANDVITPATADQGTGYAAGPGGPVRQFTNWLHRSAGEWLTWARDTLRMTPQAFSGVVEAIEGTATDGTKSAVCVVDLSASGVAEDAWGTVWSVNQGGASSNANCIDTDGEYIALGVGSELYVRERDTPSTAVFNVTHGGTIADVSTCGDEIWAAAGLNVRRYARDGASFGEFTISGTGTVTRIVAAGDIVAVLWRDLGASLSKVALYDASTLAADATFGTKSRAQISTGLAVTSDLVIIGGVDDSGYAEAYDRDSGAKFWTLALDDSSSTPTVAAIAATSERVVFVHATDDNGYEVTCATTSASSVVGTPRTLWQKALFETTPTLIDAAIDDRFAYVLSDEIVHVLDLATGQEEAQIDVAGSSGGNALATDGDLVFVAHDFASSTNMTASRVRRGAQLWRRHGADDRYRTRYALLTPQR